MNVVRTAASAFSSASWMQAHQYDAASNRTEFDNLQPSTFPLYDNAVLYDNSVLEPAPTAQWKPPATGSQFNSLNQMVAFQDRLSNQTNLGYDAIESRLATIGFPNSVSTALAY